jgi:hypothetical protein
MCGRNRHFVRFAPLLISSRLPRSPGDRKAAQAQRVVRACGEGFHRSAAPQRCGSGAQRIEEHWFSTRWASNGAMLSVVYRWSESDPATTKIRLILAREAAPAEIRRYEESL